MMSPCQHCLSNRLFSASGCKTTAVSWGRIFPLASEPVMVQHGIFLLSSERPAGSLSLPRCGCRCEGPSCACPSSLGIRGAACVGSWWHLDDVQLHARSSYFMLAGSLCVSPDSFICPFRKHSLGLCSRHYGWCSVRHSESLSPPLLVHMTSLGPGGASHLSREPPEQRVWCKNRSLMGTRQMQCPPHQDRGIATMERPKECALGQE